MTPLTITSTVKLSSGQNLPLLGLGVAKNDECGDAIKTALEIGYRHVDTAQYYENEDKVGAAVKSSGVPREQIWITSKLVEVGDKTAVSVKASLAKLDLDYIDLYLIHSAHGGKDIRLQTYKTLLEFAGPGKPLRSIGVSNYNVKHLEEIREAGLPPPTVNQVELHPLCQQRPIVEYCKKHGIVIEAYCPIIRGDFSNPILQEVAKESNRTPAQVLVRWSIQKGFVPLPKSSSAARIASNADIYDFELSDTAMEKLDALDRGAKGAISWNPVDVD